MSFEKPRALEEEPKVPLENREEGIERHVEEDLESMQKMAKNLTEANNKTRKGTEGYFKYQDLRDEGAIKAVLRGHPHEITNFEPGRVVSENDHFDNAAKKLVEAYPHTPEAEELRKALERSDRILQPDR